MVLFNYSTRELTAKIVYYGPGLCGKTTNLQWIHEKIPIKNKGKMLSLATEADRTLFFDFLPIELGTIRGMRTRIQLYTVPGQVFYNATRRMVLKGADCVVFVADSQEPMLDADVDSFQNLRENLEANEIDPDEIPIVLQYNKRDLPNALPVPALNERLNARGLPFLEAVATRGQGVEETLKAATGLVFRTLSAKYGSGEAARPPVPAAEGVPEPEPLPEPAARPPAQDDLLESLGAASEPAPFPEPSGTRLPLGDSEVTAPVLEPSAPADFEAGPGPESDLDLGAPEPDLNLSPPEPETLNDLPGSGAGETALEVPSSSLEEGELQLEAYSEETQAFGAGESTTLPPEPPQPQVTWAAETLEPEPAESADLSDELEPEPPSREPRRPRSSPMAPVRIQVPGDLDHTDVAIPVEVTLDRGSAQVQVYLTLTLRLRLEDEKVR